MHVKCFGPAREEELCDGYELGKLCQIKGVCREPRELLKPATTKGKKSPGLIEDWAKPLRQTEDRAQKPISEI